MDRLFLAAAIMAALFWTLVWQPDRTVAYAAPQQSARHGPPQPQTAASAALQSQVEQAKGKALGDGSYACCLQKACAWCMLSNGRCHCALTIGKERAICRECHGGWEAGEGRIPGVTREDVRQMRTYGH